MKLLTLNCHSWQEENQLEKIKYIAQVINEKDYDVIALQEVSQLIESEVAYDNIKKDNFALMLTEELQKLGNTNYRFYWDFAHIGFDIYEEGLCVMTKLPIKETESFFISKSDDTNFWKARKITKLIAEYKGKEMSFYSCHLGWWEDEEEPFKYQADRLLEEVSKDELAFVMGDFNNNANKRREGYDYISSRLKDTFNMADTKDEGITVKGKIAGWDENKEHLRLDIIFSNQDLDVTKSNVIFNGKNKDIVSDHYGVELDISL